MTRHFVQLNLGGKTFKDQVSTEGCQDVDDFRAAIKNKCTNLLKDYDAGQLVLFQPDGTTEIDPGEAIEKLIEFKVEPWNPLVVTVDEMPTKVTNDIPKKQLSYKVLGVESTCRKYLDALAENLARFYSFKWGPEDENDYPTFDDVLYAYKKNEWNHRYRQQSISDESGLNQVPRLSIRLPDLFDKDEWLKLNEWNQKTNKRIHDANVPKTSTGKSFIIIPHADYNKETISFFKTIGVKGRLYDHESRLEVKDEGDSSGI